MHEVKQLGGNRQVEALLALMYLGLSSMAFVASASALPNSSSRRCAAALLAQYTASRGLRSMAFE